MICVTSFNISWDPPNITCGNVSYEVSVAQSPVEGDAVNNTTTADTFFSIIGLNNSLLVTVTVTATDRVGQRNGNTTYFQLRISKGKFVYLWC